MLAKPMRPCRSPRCPNLTEDKTGYCPEHKKQSQQQQDSRRGSSTQRGYNYRWQKYSEAYLKAHPLCVYCLAKEPSVIRAAECVDHFIPHKGDYKLFWDPANHRASCIECNSVKAAKEDGAFGNPSKPPISEGEGAQKSTAPQL
jgi:5-methylcytosine-specific restriction protein A